MARTTRWALVYALLAAGAVAVVACATGGARDDGDDKDYLDAATSPPPEASTPIPDAPPMTMPMPDAAVPMPVADAFVPPPDAPPNAFFCSSNAQCTTPGECCFTFGGPMGFCVPGTVVLGQCIPQ